MGELASTPRALHRILLVALIGAAGVAAWSLGAGVAERRAWANDRPLEPIGHVHALVAPSWLHGDVLVGTHQGLLRWSEADGWRTVGGDRHDLMGLAADPERAGVLYASGHPDLRSGLGNPLGLIVSQDAGRTWDARSLVERSDFHALVATPEAVWGWDVINASMVRSLDGGRTWERGDDGGFTATDMVFALAAESEAGGRAFAATRDGVWATEDDRTWRPLAFRGAAVTALHLASDGGLWAYVAGGETGLVRSPDRGTTWERVPLELSAGAAAIALASDPEDADRVFVAATNGDVLRSPDRGATWAAIMRAGDPR